MPDASPLKWHLAHTSWFFEQFVLAPLNVPPLHPRYAFLFNSYYDAVGARWSRPARGLMTRPTLAETLAYRHHVDAHVRERIPSLPPDLRATVELGIQHEEQHQELMLTDVTHLLSLNPLEPIYRPSLRDPEPLATALEWIELPEGTRVIGAEGSGFAFDNERPRHRALVGGFAIASRLVTNGEYAQFVADGGYERADLWLSDGWDVVQREGWRAPLYWRPSDAGERQKSDGRWQLFGPGGCQPLPAHAPLRNVSYYEADAFARWSGARLPTEQEWETAARERRGQLSQLDDERWQWTQSAYAAYPGYRPLAGALGEYNGKFMCNQLVLRGGSRLTPRRHVRPSYRNFFPPTARWQWSGLRLARDLEA
jgi:ergothioneine biosynthesis protein EgtB